MKKFFILLPFLLVIGCTNVPETPNLPAPTNLTITAIDDGLGLKLKWDAVPEADGYYIYFIKVKSETLADTLALCKVLTPYFVDEPYDENLSPSIEERGCGDYLVVPVRRIYDKDTIGLPASISSRPIKTGQRIINEKNKADSAAYGWNESGVGSVYSITDTINEWDIYVSDADSSRIIDTLFHFVSPPYSMAWQDDGPPPGPKWDTTLVEGPIDEEVAPKKDSYDWYVPGYGAGIKEKDEIYYLFVDRNYYVKVVIDTVLPDGVMLDSYFQSVKGFRRF